MEGEFTVRPTRAKDRRAARHDFVACVTRATKRETGLGPYAVVIHPNAGVDGAETFAVHCRVVVDDSDDQLADDELRLDHLARTALDVPFQAYEGDDCTARFDTVGVRLAPLKVPWHVRGANTMARWVGARYIFMRVVKADIPDIECHISRLPVEAFSALGVPATGRIVVEGVKLTDGPGGWRLTRHRTAAFELTNSITERRERQQKSDKARYPIPGEQLNSGNDDVWSIWLDQMSRDELGVASLDPVKVRQQSRSIFLREVRESGLLFVVTTVAAAAAAAAGLSHTHHLTWKLLVGALATAGLITLFLTAVSMRARAGR